MPTKKESEYYRMGFRDGMSYVQQSERLAGKELTYAYEPRDPLRGGTVYKEYSSDKPKRKLSAWNKFVKANSKKKIFRYRNGKLNLKKMGVAFRKKRR